MTDQQSRAVSLYKPPFRYEMGYIWDADGQGRIQYLGDGPTTRALQDAVGHHIARVLTEGWSASRSAPVGRARPRLDGNVEVICSTVEERERLNTLPEGVPVYAAPARAAVPEAIELLREARHAMQALTSKQINMVGARLNLADRIDAFLADAPTPPPAAEVGLREAVIRNIVGSLSQPARDVITERQRQISVEGWTPEHDDEHDDGAIARAAACCAVDNANLTDLTTGKPIWPSNWLWKCREKRRQLVVAGALILAEIERLDRAAVQAQESGR